MEKVTKMKKFEMVKGVLANADMPENEREMLVEFVENEQNQLAKKAQGRTKVQKTNEELVERVYEVIAGADGKVTVSEVFEAFRDATYPDEKGVEKKFTVNKINAMVKKLRDAGRVVRTEEKGRAYFQVAE